MFAREGTHRGSVQRLSAASPQVLLLLDGSLTHHGALRLRLVEACLLFFSFPSAARGCLLPPLSFSRLHTLCVVTRALSSELLPVSTCCVWMGRCWAPPCRRGLLVHDVNHLSALSSHVHVRLRLLTPAAIAASAVQVPRAHFAD